MGKGTIISGGEDGQYQVQVNYGRSGYTSDIAALNTKKDSLAQDIIDEGLQPEPDTNKLNSLKLQKLSVEKRIDSLESTMPDDPTVSAWCADLTEDLTGEVGTIEVPGEVGIVQIQPGYDDNAEYDAERDGQLLPTVVNSPAQAFYNLAMLPGWQKWKPTFRYGTITSVDEDADTANVTLDTTPSSQQSLDINQSTTLSDVPIDYMDCDSLVFTEGDEVLIKFENQDWASSKIVGFKDNPKPCATGYFIVKTQANAGDSFYCIVWDLGRNALANDVTDNSSDLVTSWPVDISTISDWIAERDDVGTDCVNSEVQNFLGPDPSFPTTTSSWPMSGVVAGLNPYFDEYDEADEFYSGSPAVAYKYITETGGTPGEKGYYNWDYIGGRCGTAILEYIYDSNLNGRYWHDDIEQILNNVVSPVSGMKYTALVDSVWTVNVPNLHTEQLSEGLEEDEGYDCFELTEDPGDLVTTVHWNDPFMGTVTYQPPGGTGSDEHAWHFEADGLYGNTDCPFCIVIACKCLKVMPDGLGDPNVDMPLTYYARSKYAGSDESGNPANLNPYQLNENADLGDAVQDLVEYVDNIDGYPETSWSHPHTAEDGIIQPELTLQLLEKEVAV